MVFRMLYPAPIRLEGLLALLNSRLRNFHGTLLNGPYRYIWHLIP